MILISEIEQLRKNKQAMEDSAKVTKDLTPTTTPDAPEKEKEGPFFVKKKRRRQRRLG